MEVSYSPEWTKFLWFIRRNKCLEHFEPGKNINNPIKPSLICAGRSISGLVTLCWIKAD